MPVRATHGPPAARPTALRAALLGLSLLLAPAPPARAQSAPPAPPRAWQVTRWTTADGLPQGTVNEVLQTPDGELWIATFGGLLRFDGLRFRAIDVDTLAALPTNRLTALCSDGRDGLWAATQYGDLLRFRAGALLEVRPRPREGLEVLSLRRAADGVLWMRESSGALHRLEEARWSTPVAAGLGGEFEDFVVEAGGTVLAARGDRLLTLDAEGGTLQSLVAPANVRCVARSPELGLLLGLRDGLARLAGDRIERIATDPPLDEAVLAVLVVSSEELWVGTRNGPRRVFPRPGDAPWILMPRLAELPPRLEVRALGLDREGNVWVGALGEGLARLTPRHVERFGDDLGKGSVAAVVSDGAGGAWVASDCAGLVRFARGSPPRPLEQLSSGDKPVCVQSLLLDAAGRLWIGQEQRLLLLDEAAGEGLGEVASMAAKIGPMAQAGDGTVTVATASGRVTSFGPDALPRESFEVPGQVHSLAWTAGGDLWIGGEGCVWRRRAGRLERFGQEHGVPRGDVRDLLAGAGDSVWLATYGGGLARLEGVRAVRVSSAQGLPDVSLSRILEDGQGRVWLLSNRGLMVVERAELEDVALGRLGALAPIVLGPEAGVAEARYGFPAGYRDELGRLGFGTLSGVVRVDPAAFPYRRTPPIVRIELLEGAGRALAPGADGLVRVPAATRRLQLEFTAFAFSAPERVRFRYRLTGYDEGWVEAGFQRRASYTGLPPGGYAFEVIARNEDGVWSAEPASLRLEVLPTWWQTRWFRYGSALLAVLLLVGLHALRTRAVDRRARTLVEATEGRRLAEERESRLRDELAHVARVATTEGLAASLAHEVNQPLSAIATNAMAARRLLARRGGDGELDEILTDIDQQGRRASEVVQRLRSFLAKRTSERRAVELERLLRDTLPLVRRELSDHRAELALDLEPAPAWVSADPVQLQQVLVNLIKNACEAMASSPGPRRIELRARRAGERVRVEVEDSGPGLEAQVAARLYEPFVTTKAGGMGLGLSISRTIVEAHGGRLAAGRGRLGGALFGIDLPLEAPQRSSGPPGR